MTMMPDPVPADPSVAQSFGGTSGKRPYNLSYLTGVALVASAGGFLFGFDTALIAGALPFLKREFVLSSAWTGWAAGSATMGAMIGPLLGLWFADAIGRRRTMMLSALGFLLSTIGCSIATTIGQFVLWRVVGGMGVGLAMISCPIYIAELSPPAGGRHRHQLMFASQGVPVAILIFGLLLVPESPRWLTAKGHTARALAVLKRGGTRAAEFHDRVAARPG